ncbi:MAG: leucine-rich repeat domain-containing protein [Candidatus Thorarchaeota archaeon]
MLDSFSLRVMMSNNYIVIRYTSWDGRREAIEIGYKSKVLNLHHRKISQIDLTQIEHLENLEIIDLRCNRLEVIDLYPLSNCSKLRTLNLSENKLHSIDLEPLRGLSQLDEIDLSMNSLRTLDISPLAGKKYLRGVNLSRNRLKQIDLYPFATCDRLRYLSLPSNNLHEVNLAPLLLCMFLERLEISGNVDFKPSIEAEEHEHSFSAVLVDALVRRAWQYGNPSWVRGSRMINDIYIPQYEDLIQRLGWKKTRDGIREAFRRDRDLKPFGIQKKLFEKLGMSELFGLDLYISDILKDLPHLKSGEEGMVGFYDSIVSKILQQLQSGGSTLFFDVQKLSTTRGAIIIDYLIRRRKEELKEVVLPVDQTHVNLWPLWLTSYGFEILRKLGVKEQTTLTTFKQIAKSFLEIGFKLRTEDVSTSNNAKFESNISSELQKLVADIMLSKSISFTAA